MAPEPGRMGGQRCGQKPQLRRYGHDAVIVVEIEEREQELAPRRQMGRPASLQQPSPASSQTGIFRRDAQEPLRHVAQRRRIDVALALDVERPAAVVVLVKFEEADEILQALKNGEDFETLAKTRSVGPNAPKGGNLGTINKGDLLPSLDDAIRSLKVNEISDVVESEIGYHIFKRLE